MSYPATTRWCWSAIPWRSRGSPASPSGSTSRPDPDQLLAPVEHVGERAERAHVVPGEALALDAGEHVGEIEVAVARAQVLLVPVAEAVGEADLGDPAHVERFDEAGHALRHEMGVVDRERQPERRRADALEIMAPLGEGVGEVVHFRPGRLLVEIFEQDQGAAP